MCNNKGSFGCTAALNCRYIDLAVSHHEHVAMEQSLLAETLKEIYAVVCYR